MNAITEPMVIDFQKAVFMATLVDIYVSDKVKDVTTNDAVKAHSKVIAYRSVMARFGADYLSVEKWERVAMESAYKAYDEGIDLFMQPNPYI